MKKKLLAIVASLMCVFGAATMSSCSLTDTLDLVFENELLVSENAELKEQVDALETELATLKFETAFPDGLVTESCILKNVKIVREVVRPEGSVYAVRADGSDVEITINGGSYNAGSGSLYNIAVWAHHNSKVVINGGEFITGNDVNDSYNHCIYAAGRSVIEINGGRFSSTGDASWLLNCQDNNGTIIVKGGTFVGFNPSEVYTEPSQPISYVAEGFTVTSQEVNGIIEYTVVPV